VKSHGNVPATVAGATAKKIALPVAATDRRTLAV
jgi:hypothetical protein